MLVAVLVCILSLVFQPSLPSHPMTTRLLIFGDAAEPSKMRSSYVPISPSVTTLTATGQLIANESQIRSFTS